MVVHAFHQLLGEGFIDIAKELAGENKPLLGISVAENFLAPKAKDKILGTYISNMLLFCGRPPDFLKR